MGEFDLSKADELDKHLMMDDIVKYLEEANPDEWVKCEQDISHKDEKFVSKRFDYQGYREKLSSIQSELAPLNIPKHFNEKQVEELKLMRQTNRDCVPPYRIYVPI